MSKQPDEWDRISVQVRRIANGFVVREEKSNDYRTAYGEELFYPTMEAVEREFVIRLKVAATMDMASAGEQF